MSSDDSSSIEAIRGPERKVANQLVELVDGDHSQTTQKVPCSSLPEFKKRGNSIESTDTIIIDNSELK